MITDERDLARSLRTAETPPGLTLDPEQVIGRAHRADRRHRAGRGALATGSVAAAAAAALWATGTNVGPMAVLPAAPWTDGCAGIVDGSAGTSINLDQVSYAELPLPGEAAGFAVVAFDACGGSAGRVAYATRGADGLLGEVESWGEPSESTVRAWRDGQAVMPQPVRSGNGEVLFGVVASGATDLQVLSDAGAVDVERETLPDTGLDAYLSQEFTDPEHETIGMTWQDEAGVRVTWLQVLDTATFDAAPTEDTVPLVAQGRDGIWRLWFGDEQANLEDALGSWTAVEFLEGEGREVVAYLPVGAEVDVTMAGGAAVDAVRYAEPGGADGRFAWVSAPSGSEVTWVGADGAREVLPEP
ncbi:hypothetical protein MWU75_11085 [Ornithinimicrobium sp. F0845]|uniref:hypothetical protein n=1 Tax=Ornithinimicrobium sp. F0845 TaxID=2926412 RepID=UPI001FF31F36|nr:hypothetical protein [Ornithinimicrobium sp. F0845]MCK0112684.1 hypothetical protein [Ornithinimicrobium sp. F0845]